jgi:acetyl-CoA carboxylase carboxyltransferase component
MSKSKNIEVAENLIDDRLEALESLFGTLSARLDALESKGQGSVSIQKEVKKPTLPDTVFSVEGKDYMFGVISFIIKAQTGETVRMTAEEALTNDDLLSHIVEHYPDLLVRV